MVDFLNWFLSAISQTINLLFSMELTAGVSVGSIVVVGFCFTVIMSLLFNVVRALR